MSLCANPPRHWMLRVPSCNTHRFRACNLRAADKPNRIVLRLRRRVHTLIDRHVRRNVCAEFRRQKSGPARKDCLDSTLSKSVARGEALLANTATCTVRNVGIFTLARSSACSASEGLISACQHPALIPSKFILCVGERFRGQREFAPADRCPIHGNTPG